MKIEEVAEICHEANRTLCQQQGDLSQEQWKYAPQWQIDSAINGVKFHLDNPDATPENSHENWLKDKEADGWKYGPAKNVEAKEHPCFVPYAELPENQKSKDHLFRSIVHGLASFVETE